MNLATLSWSTNMLLGRWLRDDIGPITLAAARFVIASLCFVMLLRGQPTVDRRLGADRWCLVGMGLLGVAVFGPTLYLALRYTSLVNATLINGLAPLMTGLLAGWLIREPMTRRQVVGAVVALAGVGVLVSAGASSGQPGGQVNPGDLIALIAVLLWSLYSVLARRVMLGRSALSATAFSAFLGLPMLLLGATCELKVHGLAFRPVLGLAVMYIGLVPTVVGFLSWNAGIRRLGASGAMVFYNTLPLYGALLGYLLLREPIGPAHLLGGSLIVGAGLWSAGRHQLQQEPPVE